MFRYNLRLVLLYESCLSYFMLSEKYSFQQELHSNILKVFFADYKLKYIILLYESISGKRHGTW